MKNLGCFLVFIAIVVGSIVNSLPEKFPTDALLILGMLFLILGLILIIEDEFT